MIALSPLMQGIQIGLFVAATALIAGVLYGMGVRTEHLKLELLTRGPQQGGKSHDEKRRQPRVLCNLFLELMDPTEHVAGMGRLLNLSSTGACIASNKELRTGDPVIARLPTLRKGANRISGHVVWVRATSGSTLYGIALHHATPTN